MSVKNIGVLEDKSKVPLPLYEETVSAGFPSPAEGYVEKTLDLNELCISHPNATYLVKVSGLSMKDIGIYPNDLLVVDRSLEASNGDIIVGSVLGEFTVKELRLLPKPRLVAHNDDYQDIELTDELDFEVFGVVTSVVRRLN